MDRRGFLAGTTASLFLSALPIPSLGTYLPKGRVILINLEGGLDGIAAAPPLGDDSLLRRRRSLIYEPNVLLDGFFGIHPILTSFRKLFDLGQASLIHATSFPYENRSHFEGQNLLETGLREPYSSKSGWLGRAMDLVNIPGRALSLNTPLVMRGAKDLESYYPAHIPETSAGNTPLLNALIEQHDPDLKPIFERLKQDSMMRVGWFPNRDPVHLATDAARAMRAEDGPRVAVIKVHDFDTHAGQGAEFGQLSSQLEIVDNVISAFNAELGSKWNDAIILTATEFGRTVAQNGSEGTDHGYGSVGLLAGGLLKGGRIVADWPGLDKKNLFQGRDLMSTLDYRAVCAACLEAAFGLEHDVIADQVFFEPKLPRIYDKLFA